jgi:SAM-dependent methyltransferase
MLNRIFRLTCAGLQRIERVLRALRRWLIRRMTLRAQIERPNNADQWDSLYAPVENPVTRLESPLARILEDLTESGESVLETGCGSATISAELALVGRRIELADFSAGILERARKLFEISRLPPPVTRLADLTKPLPWPDKSVDVTWSSGVLEHWTDEELIPIVREMTRISRRRVISLVPNSACVLYRYGKWSAERDGTWPYGRELPRRSLRGVFEEAGLSRVVESTVWPEVAVEFIRLIDPEIYREVLSWWEQLPPDDPIRQSQGYLLLTVGEIL